MTTALALGLSLQGAALGLVWACLGLSMFRRPATYLLLAAIAFGGGAEVLRLASGSPLPGRPAGLKDYVGWWQILLGCALIAFAVTYITTLHAGGSRPRAANPPSVTSAAKVAQALDWRVLGLLTIPLVIIAGTGGYSVSLTANPTVATQATSGLVGQFLPLGITLTTVGFVYRHPRRFFSAYLFALIAIVMAGQRLDVIAVAVAIPVGLALLGRRPRGRAIFAALLAGLMLVLAVSSARAQFGRDRYSQARSISARIGLIAAGGWDLILGRQAVYVDATEPIAQRLDGNTFPAEVLFALGHGSSPAGYVPAANDIRLAVPSSLDPGKLQTDPAARSEKLYEIDHFSILVVSDFIPTQLGGMLGWYGPAGLIVLSLLLGAAYGSVERAAGANLRLAAYLLNVGLLLAALSYEKTSETYPLMLRGTVVAFAVLWLVARVHSRRGAPMGLQPVVHGESQVPTSA